MNILVFDIETSPLEVLVFGLFDQNIALNQVRKDRTILSYSAKWLVNGMGEVCGPHNRMMHQNTSNKKDPRDDFDVVKGLRNLINQADVVITQNGKKFDMPILRGRCLFHELDHPSEPKHLDTYQLAKRMGFISNKLEHLTAILCPKLKKSSHKAFPGFTLWLECLKGNKLAWKEMEKYNSLDVLGTEGVYNKLAPSGTPGVNFSLLSNTKDLVCSCGSKSFYKNGHAYTPTGKFIRYKCKNCGKDHKGEKVVQ